MTAGKDGSVKMWNFSNGSKLKDMLSPETGKKIDREVTGLICVCDPDDEESKEEASIVSVGWNRKLHTWLIKDEDEDLDAKHVWPHAGKQVNNHKDDIMSAVYCRRNNYIYTGGHDGSLVCWSFETGNIKRTLHD